MASAIRVTLDGRVSAEDFLLLLQAEGNHPHGRCWQTLEERRKNVRQALTVVVADFRTAGGARGDVQQHCQPQRRNVVGVVNVRHDDVH
jgi:hypothetical protein